MKRKKVGIFIDHENLFYQLRDTVGSDVRMNYKSLLDFASRFGEVEIAKFYRPWSLRDGENRFYLSLKEVGFEIEREPLRMNR